MFICRKCGRKFSKKAGRTRHEKDCDKNKIRLDNGYEYILDKNGKVKHIHRIVMEEKLGRPLHDGEIVHHKDGNKRNNDPGNLELTDISKHGKIHYTKIPHNGKYAKGSKHGNSKLKEEQVYEIKMQLKEGIHETIICKQFNVSFDTIWDIKKERSWKHIKL